MPVRLIVSGAAGRMGARIIELARQDNAFELVYGLESDAKAASSIIAVGGDRSKIKEADVVIDFSTHEASAALAPELVRYGKAWVIGTTGFSADEMKSIRAAAEKIPVLLSPNMSLGVNALFKLVQEAAKALAGYSVEILETHHIHKKDAPSGTALRAGELIEKAGGQKATYQSFREGEAVGDHRIVFSGVGERLELFHHAESRDTFAAGALKAARWIAGKKPGFYAMQDVLSL